MSTTVPQVRPVESLTDEELSLLTYGPGVVVTPYFSELGSSELELAQRTAYRGLVARGIVDPEAAPADGTVRVALREDVETVVTLRQAARRVVAVARTYVDAQDFWYAHVVEDLVVLEDVTTDGIHRFALGFTRDLPTLLVNAAIHPDAVSSSGAVVNLTALPDETAPTELLELLGQAHVRADVVVMDADRLKSEGRPELIGLFTGPQGSWSITSTPLTGAIARPEQVEPLRARLRTLAESAMSLTEERAS